MIFVDPDLWGDLQGDIEAALTSSCRFMYDRGQDNKPYPEPEVQYWARYIMDSVKQALAEQAERDCNRRGVQAGS